MSNDYPCPHCINGLNYQTLGHAGPMEGFYRVLVTGWRYWPRKEESVIHDQLNWIRAAIPPYIYMVVVEGMCPVSVGGVDTFANEWAIENRTNLVYPERHPAIYTSGKLHGPERNTHMVSLGARYMLSFPESGEKQNGGTWDCTRKGIEAGFKHRITPYRPSTGAPRVSLDDRGTLPYS